jgi:hypothetical protein
MKNNGYLYGSVGLVVVAAAAAGWFLMPLDWANGQEATKPVVGRHKPAQPKDAVPSGFALLGGAVSGGAGFNDLRPQAGGRQQQQHLHLEPQIPKFAEAPFTGAPVTPQAHAAGAQQNGSQGFSTYGDTSQGNGPSGGGGGSGGQQIAMASPGGGYGYGYGFGSVGAGVGAGVSPRTTTPAPTGNPTPTGPVTNNIPTPITPTTPPTNSPTQPTGPDFPGNPGSPAPTGPTDPTGPVTQKFPDNPPAPPAPPTNVPQTGPTDPTGPVTQKFPDNPPTPPANTPPTDPTGPVTPPPQGTPTSPTGPQIVNVDGPFPIIVTLNTNPGPNTGGTDPGTNTGGTNQGTNTGGGQNPVTNTVTPPGTPPVTPPVTNRPHQVPEPSSLIGLLTAIGLIAPRIRARFRRS